MNGRVLVGLERVHGGMPESIRCATNPQHTADAVCRYLYPTPPHRYVAMRFACDPFNIRTKARPPIPHHIHMCTVQDCRLFLNPVIEKRLHQDGANSQLKAGNVEARAANGPV